MDYAAIAGRELLRDCLHAEGNSFLLQTYSKSVKPQVDKEFTYLVLGIQPITIEFTLFQHFYCDSNRYLTHMRQKDDRFMFEIDRDVDGRPIGVMWQTGHQRAAFEDFGDVLCLDFMKKRTSNLNWPYIGPCGISGENRLAVFGEGICTP